ncbi:MAG TPA: UDP-glucose 4-epimerase GalE [Rhodobacteraceae bacterium]|jgi:UDP-glucose 4-epimerase|nr:UDP-glucose 4-epimerase GalE [Paracoccaceae bacterium]
MTHKILLTGGAGYIGAHTFVALQAAGFSPFIFDNFSNADKDTPERIASITGQTAPWVKGDLLDKTAIERVFADNDFDAVIHFAAKKSVADSVHRPLDYFENNCVGLINLLEVIEKYSVKTFVFSSSATVYGTPQRLPIPETATLSFANPYGFTKLVGEQMLAQISLAQPELTVGILRYFNPVGAHASGLLLQAPRGNAAPPENLMPRMLEVARGQNPYLTVYGDDYDTPDGTGLRDYIHITDLARGHVLSLQNLLQSGEGHTVNLGTGNGYSVLEMIECFKKVSQKDLTYRIVPRRAGDIASCYADVSLAFALLGFKAEFGLLEMCASSWNAAQM